MIYLTFGMIVSDVLTKVIMVRKKIDNRVRVLIENGVTQGRRSMFVVVGDKAKDQVWCNVELSRILFE